MTSVASCFEHGSWLEIETPRNLTLAMSRYDPFGSRETGRYACAERRAQGINIERRRWTPARGGSCHTLTLEPQARELPGKLARMTQNGQSSNR